MWNRRRRKAISQSKIRKEFHLLGPFMEGFRAFRGAKPGDRLVCPYDPYSQDERAWLAGVDFGAERDERHAIRQDVPRSIPNSLPKKIDPEERPGNGSSP